MRLSDQAIPADGSVTASLEIENIGAVAGDEVVQLYTRAISPSIKRPVKELRGFSRVSLKPGEKQTVNFTLPGSKLAFWDEKTHGFVTERGAYELLIGSSSADIRAKETLEVK